MKKTQSGFTLVELMIVITMIAILLAIALPAYQNYTKRSHVSEGLSLASGVKASVSEHYAARGSWPTNNTIANIGSDIKANAISGISVTDGVITIEFNNRVEAGKRLELSPYADTNTITWKCKSANTDGINELYLPSRCRS